MKKKNTKKQSKFKSFIEKQKAFFIKKKALPNIIIGVLIFAQLSIFQDINISVGEISFQYVKPLPPAAG